MWGIINETPSATGIKLSSPYFWESSLDTRKSSSEWVSEDSTQVPCREAVLQQWDWGGSGSDVSKSRLLGKGSIREAKGIFGAIKHDWKNRVAQLN